MKKVTFSYEHSRVTQASLARYHGKLTDEITHMKQVIRSNEYEDARSSINLCSDTKLLRSVSRVVKEKKALKPDLLIVIGIGGSNLGTVAIHEAINGKYYNDLHDALLPRVLFADTVDTESIHQIRCEAEAVLKKKGTVLINSISKSGGTTETIAITEVFVSLLQEYKKNYQQYVVVTTDKHSHFYNLSLVRGFTTLEIPAIVGGRYSVFSAVGLFPLGMIGVNLKALFKGAEAMRKRCVDKRSNPALESAGILFELYKKGYFIYDLFVFSNSLESLGKWYRQLMGESIGKEFDVAGKRILTGITPTVSVGSTDMHSVGQLYLGGPYNRYSTLVSVARFDCRVMVPHYADFDLLVPHIQKKPLKTVMQAILEGVSIAYKKSKRPFSECVLPALDEYSVGQFIQFKMMEIMYLGALLNVNPFDQPNVESYKVETKRILAR